MWFALRPTPPSLAPGSQIMMAEKTAVPPAPGQQEQIQASAASQPAAPLPAKPSAVGNSTPPALAQEKEAQNLDHETFSSAANAPAKQKDALRDEASNEARSSAPPEQDKKAVSGAPAAEADRTAPVALPAPGQQTQAATVTGAVPAVTAGSAGAAGGAGAAAPPRRSKRKPHGGHPRHSQPNRAPANFRPITQSKRCLCQPQRCDGEGRCRADCLHHARSRRRMAHFCQRQHRAVNRSRQNLAASIERRDVGLARRRRRLRQGRLDRRPR